jgi:thiol-disulfide isomerase/thioredoxin
MIPSLAGATTWINSAPIPPQELRGKVVLIDFWTYTCINWRRTVPSLRAWFERYAKSGLLLIGAHSPEFPFEKDLDNVRQFTREFGVDWPVAVDTDFSIWRAFGNEYWPALYVFDAKGRLRHQTFGEDGYPRPSRSSGSCSRRQDSAIWDRRRRPSTPPLREAGGLEGSPVARELPRPAAHGGLRVAGRHRLRGGSPLRGSGEDVAQPMGALGRLDRGAGPVGRRGGRCEDELPVPRAGSPPRHGPETRGTRSGSASGSTASLPAARTGSTWTPTGTGR